jgi:hypothetical protein
MANSQTGSSRSVETARKWFVWVIGGFFFVGGFLILLEIPLYLTGHGWNEEIQKYATLDVLKSHWAAIVGIPVLAFFSLFLIFLTRIVSGEIKFKLGEAEISGAASEGLMWIFVFLSLVWGFSELWKLGI